jgi:predicted NAD-dependent protein-ADP-ribosyltransferase YbiA (DUF1768 family)
MEHAPKTIVFTTNPNIRYGFLSNFAESPFEVPYLLGDRMILVPVWSVEAEFQAIKYDPLPTDSLETQALKVALQHIIRTAPTSAEASMLGRDDARCHDCDLGEQIRMKLEPFRKVCLRPRPDWESTQDNTMMFLLRKKFEYPRFRMKLMATRDAPLVFHCPRDLYWGSANGLGRNRLGEMLMWLREEIRAE